MVGYFNSSIVAFCQKWIFNVLALFWVGFLGVGFEVQEEGGGRGKITRSKTRYNYARNEHG